MGRKGKKGAGFPKELRHILKGGAEKFLVGNQAKGEILINMGMHKTPNPKTIHALHGMLDHFYSLGLGYNLIFRMPTGSDVTAMRNQTADDAMKRETVVGVLFLDDDMRWPSGQSINADGSKGTGFNALDRLLARDKDVVGALCTNRSIPLVTNAGMENEKGLADLIMDERADPENGTPFQLDFLGFGFIYVKRRVFEMIHDKLGVPMDRMFDAETNWRFLPGIDERLKKIMAKMSLEYAKVEIDKLMREATQLSEDFSFCRRARLAGCEVWCDPSFELQHLGDYPYSRLDLKAQKKLDEQIKQEQEAAEAQEAAAGG